MLEGVLPMTLSYVYWLSKFSKYMYIYISNAILPHVDNGIPRKLRQYHAC